MRLVSLIVTMVVASVLTFYVLTCSVNNAPPAPVHPIVGKWQQTVISGYPVDPLTYITDEFRADGTVCAEGNDPRHGHYIEEGAYTLDGNTVHLFFPNRIDKNQQISFIIHSLSTNRLAIRGDRTDPESMQSIMVRIREK